MTERQCLRSELRENLYRPLWGAKKQSPASLDGVVRCFPSESPVGPLTRPSGLSRAQQLVIFNTLKVILLPSFCQTHGGLVMDPSPVQPYSRGSVGAGSGGAADRDVALVVGVACENEGAELKSVGAGDNYCLSLRSKARLSRSHFESRLGIFFYVPGSRTSVEATVETDDAANVRQLFTRPSEEERENTWSRWDGIGGRLEITHKFDPYKLLVSCAFRERIQTQGSSLFLPALLSTEVVANDLHRPFHFRLGLHQMLDVFPDAPDVMHDCNNGIYFQGGFGVDGVATLLKSPKVKRKTKQDRLDQMRETKLGDVSFEHPFTESRSYDAKERRANIPTPESDKAFPSAEVVLKRLQDHVSSLKQSSERLAKATEDVKGGSLKGWRRRLEQGFFGIGKGIRSHAFLPPAHLKIGGLAGMVASFGIHKDGLDRVSLSDGGYASPGLRHRANLRWKAALDDHPIKAFLGCSVSTQLGRMRRRVLSFTSAMAQCECTVPITLGQSSLPRRIQTIAASSRRTLMIGPVPLKPLVNLSFVQQIFGPLRAKVDYRVALETSHSLGSMPNLHPANAFLRQVQSIRPCIVDAQYGFDVVVPGTQGAVKFCGWYAPYKKEAMAELRMF